eukprot:1210826-Pleurochrysis_carterae.AAC.2
MSSVLQHAATVVRVCVRARARLCICLSLPPCVYASLRLCVSVRVSACLCVSLRVNLCACVRASRRRGRRPVEHPCLSRRRLQLGLLVLHAADAWQRGPAVARARGRRRDLHVCAACRHGVQWALAARRHDEAAPRRLPRAHARRLALLAGGPWAPTRAEAACREQEAVLRAVGRGAHAMLIGSVRGPCSETVAQGVSQRSCRTTIS